ncbi:MAG TPA: hypothetical protein VFQ88_15095 [Nevskiaceae bacterium]|nr:hypothetical protein [Nevskiaceae bacterium]
MSRRYVQIRYQPTGAVIAAGSLGWGITPFEGNYYISRRYLREGAFHPDFIPGVCPYKGMYVGLNYVAPNDALAKHLGWLYWLPNPLFPFIMFRVAIPGQHPLLMVEPIDEPVARAHNRAPQTAAPDQQPKADLPATCQVAHHAP